MAFLPAGNHPQFGRHHVVATGKQAWLCQILRAISRGPARQVTTTHLPGSRDKTVKLWDAQDASCLQTLEGHKWQVRAAALVAVQLK